MRARFGGLAVAAMLLAISAGCDTPGDHEPQSVIAGRACQVITFDVVASTLGVRFDVAGSARTDETDTCVLGQTGRSAPDLTFAASATEADELIFHALLEPAQALELPDLGRAAYQSVIASSADSGPVVEIGWLSQAPKLLILTFTFAAGADDAQVQAMAGKLLTLAQSIEQSVLKPSLP